jgi:integrase
MGRLRIKTRSKDRTVKLNQEQMEAINEQIQRFRDKFGRDPGPSDPLFFDPFADEPVPYPQERLNREMEEAMVRAGWSPEQIYAWHRTGAIVSEISPPKLQKEWTDAIEEYRRLEKGLKH